MARIYSPQIFHLPTDFIQNTQPRNLEIAKSTNWQIAKSANYFLYLKKSSYLYRNFSTTPPLKEVRELAQRSMC